MNLTYLAKEVFLSKICYTWRMSCSCGSEKGAWHVNKPLVRTCVNSGWRWPSSGRALAASTRGEALDGPGPSRVFLGKFMGTIRDSGGGCISADMLNEQFNTLNFNVWLEPTHWRSLILERKWVITRNGRFIFVVGVCRYDASEYNVCRYSKTCIKRPLIRIPKSGYFTCIQRQNIYIFFLNMNKE